MAANEDDTVDGLGVSLWGEAEQFNKMFEEAVKAADLSAKDIDRITNDMANGVVKDTEVAVASLIKMRQEIERGLDEKYMESVLDKIREPVEAKGLEDAHKKSEELTESLHHLHTAFWSLSSMSNAAHGELKGYGKEAAEVTKTVSEVAKSLKEISHLGASGMSLKDKLPAFGGIGTGTMGVGLTGIAGGATVAAAALTTFTVALTGVTYAISGWEGLKNIPANVFEGLKIALYGVTGGLVDYTTATATAKQAEESMARQRQDNVALIAQKHAEALGIIQNLDKSVSELGDHGKAAEKKFLEGLTALGQLGLTVQQIETVKNRAHDAFAAERATEMVTKLQEQAFEYGKTKQEIFEYKLGLENATDAQREAVKQAFAKIAAVDAEKTHLKEVKKLEEEAAREHKRIADERKREDEKLTREGETLHNSLRTENEKANDEAKKAIELYKLRKISVEDLNRAIKKLDEGPKEHVHKIKLLTSKDIGVNAAEVGSVEYFAGIDAFRSNLNAAKKPTFREEDRGVRARGLLPGGARGPDGATLTKDEQETRQILNEMKTLLTTIATNSDPKKVIRIAPARVGAGT